MPFVSTSVNRDSIGSIKDTLFNRCLGKKRTQAKQPDTQRPAYAIRNCVHQLHAAAQEGKQALHHFYKAPQRHCYKEHADEGLCSANGTWAQPQKGKATKQYKVNPLIYKRYIYLGYVFAWGEAANKNEQGP